MRKSAKFLAMVLSVLMLVGTFAFGASAGKFTDVDASDEALNKAVGLLATLGITKGTSETTFGTTELVTRQQMAAFVYRLMKQGKSVENGSNNTAFTDLEDGIFFYMISWANDQGIIKGTSATTFNPKGNITLQDAYVMLIRALGYEKVNGAYAYPYGYIDEAESIGLGDDIPSSVGYTTKLTRGNIAILLYNAFYADMATGETGYESLGYEIVGTNDITGKAIIHSLGETPYTIYDTIAEKIYGVEKTVQRIIATPSYRLDDNDFTKDDGDEFVIFDVIANNKDHRGDECLGMVPFADLGFTGKADDYFLADCTVYSKDDEILAADSNLVKKTLANGSIKFERATGTSSYDCYPSKSSGSFATDARYRVMTGKVTIDGATNYFFDAPWSYAKPDKFEEKDSENVRLLFLGADESADPEDEEYAISYSFESDKDSWGRGDAVIGSGDYYGSANFQRLKIGTKEMYQPGLYSVWGIYNALGRGLTDGVQYEMDVWDCDGDGRYEFAWYKPYTVGRLNTDENELTIDNHCTTASNYSCIMQDGYPTIFTGGAYVADGAKPVDKSFAVAYVNGPANYVKIANIIGDKTTHVTVTKTQTDESPIYLNGTVYHRWGRDSIFIGLMSSVGSIYGIDRYMNTDDDWRYTGSSNFTSGTLKFNLNDEADVITYAGAIIYAEGASNQLSATSDYVFIPANKGDFYAYSYAAAISTNGILDSKNYIDIYKNGAEISVPVKVIDSSTSIEVNGKNFVKQPKTAKLSSGDYDFSEYVDKPLTYTVNSEGLYSFEIAPLECYTDKANLSDAEDDSLLYGFSGLDYGVTTATFVKSGSYYRFGKLNSDEVKESVAPSSLVQLTDKTRIVIKSYDDEGETEWSEFSSTKQPNFGNDVVLTNIQYVVSNNPKSTKIEDLIFLYGEMEDSDSTGLTKTIDLRIVESSYTELNNKDETEVFYNVFDPFLSAPALERGYESYNHDTGMIANMGDVVLLSDKLIADHIVAGSLTQFGDMCTSDVTMTMIKRGDIQFGYQVVEDYDVESGYLFTSAADHNSFRVTDKTIVTFIDFTEKNPTLVGKTKDTIASTSKTYRNGVDATMKVFISSSEVKKEEYEDAIIVVIVKDEPTT